MSSHNRSSSTSVEGINARYVNAAKFASTGTLLFTLFALIMLYSGWVNKFEHLWTPENGFGYYTGILGGTMMLLLLLYPLRKRSKMMGNLFPIKYWFKTHMMFGVMGPVLIMMHSSFSVGSLNGQVALYSMITVAISGLVGRYIYVKIHYGLYGTRVAYGEIKSDSHYLNDNLQMLYELLPHAREELTRFEQDVLDTVGHELTGYRRRTALRIKGLRLYKCVEKEFKSTFHKSAKKEGIQGREYRHVLKSTLSTLRTHKQALLKLNELNYYERLFSAWHVLHLPLFIMMVITGIIHVYAVHVY